MRSQFFIPTAIPARCNTMLSGWVSMIELINHQCTVMLKLKLQLSDKITWIRQGHQEWTHLEFTF
jgi:hypothetical protein